MSELERITYEMHDKIAEENCCASLEMNEVDDAEWLAYFDREAENDALARGLDVDFKSYEG